jgi:hypothetical protein
VYTDTYTVHCRGAAWREWTRSALYSVTSHMHQTIRSWCSQSVVWDWCCTELRLCARRRVRSGRRSRPPPRGALRWGPAGGAGALESKWRAGSECQRRRGALRRAGAAAARRRIAPTRTDLLLLIIVSYTKKSDVWGKIKIGVYCLFFRAKPTVLGVLAGFAAGQ